MGQGTGLGLAATYGTIQTHKGTIEVDSEIGRGTTFRLRFPSAAPGTRPAKPEHKLERRPGRGLVLLVDDEPMIIETASEMLRRLGYEVETATDGIQAVERFREDPTSVDIVILDLTMPRMSGRDAMARLREIDPKTPLVISSGYALNTEDQGELKADGLLQKPFNLDELSRAVSTAMELR